MNSHTYGNQSDNEEPTNNDITDTSTHSNEAKAAHLRQQLIYHPFHDKNRKSVYNMQENEPVPDNLSEIKNNYSMQKKLATQIN